MNSRFVRLAETGRPSVSLEVDGVEVSAKAGDTLMVAILTATETLRRSEFGGERRAGFCLMGACQDCWVWSHDGTRLRACSTEVVPGMSVSTQAPEATWPHIAPSHA